jgi:AraC family transcriptional regulator
MAEMSPYEARFWSAGVDLYSRELVYPSRYCMSQHLHDRAHIVYVLNGSVRSRWRGTEVVNEVGSLFYLPAGEPHTNDFTPGFRSLDVWFDSDWLPGPLTKELTLGSPAEHHEGVPIQLAARLHRELLRADDLTPLLMHSLAIELLAQLVREPRLPREKVAPRWLVRAKDYLHAEYRHTPKIESIAEAVHVNPQHLARTFKRHYGMHIGEYVRVLRIEEGRRLLAGTDQCIGEIALHLGFADQGHFCRSFKQETGVTPSRFRRAR